jgi:hypothetical protein
MRLRNPMLADLAGSNRPGSQGADKYKSLEIVDGNRLTDI